MDSPSLPESLISAVGVIFFSKGGDLFLSTFDSLSWSFFIHFFVLFKKISCFSKKSGDLFDWSFWVIFLKSSKKSADLFDWSFWVIFLTDLFEELIFLTDLFGWFFLTKKISWFFWLIFLTDLFGADFFVISKKYYSITWEIIVQNSVFSSNLRQSRSHNILCLALYCDELANGVQFTTNSVW